MSRIRESPIRSVGLLVKDAHDLRDSRAVRVAISAVRLAFSCLNVQHSVFLLAS